MKQVSKTSLFLGACDPGVRGGLAFYAGEKVSAHALGNDAETCRLMREAKEEAHLDVLYMEEVGGYIGKEQPGAYMFTFGDAFGFMRGACEMAGIRLVLVRPQRWMKAVAPGVIGMEYEERKRALRALAASWYPEIEVTKATADALGILRYGHLFETGQLAKADPTVAIARTSNWRTDAAEAKKWAKANKWPIPKRGTKEFTEMVNYYCREIKGR